MGNLVSFVKWWKKQSHESWEKLSQRIEKEPLSNLLSGFFCHVREG